MRKPLEYEYHMTPDSKFMKNMKWTFFIVFWVIILAPFTASPFVNNIENQGLFLFFVFMSLVCDFLSLTLTYSLNQYVIEDIEKEM